MVGTWLQRANFVAQTAHFTCQQQDCIGITRGDPAPCMHGGLSETFAAVSVRSLRMPVFSWIATQKRVYESGISCRSRIASGVGWHSVCGGASHGDVGPLERRLALLLRHFPTAQSPRLYIRHLFRVVVWKSTNFHLIFQESSPHTLNSRRSLFCLQRYEHPCVFTYQTVLVSVIANTT